VTDASEDNLELIDLAHTVSVKGATTHSVATLEAILVSLANEGEVNLSDIRELDGERRVWLASLIVGIHQLKDTEMSSAAGLPGVEDSQLKIPESVNGHSQAALHPIVVDFLLSAQQPMSTLAVPPEGCSSP
jgi:hypothetical protein